MVIDGYRDGPWGWFIYDVCVAAVEGDVHHASAKRFRELMTQAGLQAIAQRVFHGPAPFLIPKRSPRNRSRWFLLPIFGYINPPSTLASVPDA